LVSSKHHDGNNFLKVIRELVSLINKKNCNKKICKKYSQITGQMPNLVFLYTIFIFSPHFSSKNIQERPMMSIAFMVGGGLLPLLPTIGEHILELLTGLHWTCML
jgi:hypothetical protein